MYVVRVEIWHGFKGFSTSARHLFFFFFFLVRGEGAFWAQSASSVVLFEWGWDQCNWGQGTRVDERCCGGGGSGVACIDTSVPALRPSAVDVPFFFFFFSLWFLFALPLHMRGIE